MQVEHDLLIRASEPFASDVRFDHAVEELDWALFLDAAYRHRVAAMVGVALDRNGCFEPDSRFEHVGDALNAALARNERRNARLIGEAVRLTALLREQGVDVAVRKGLYLTPAVYGELGLRPMNDIDLFIHPREAQKAAEMLSQEGYVPGRVDGRGGIEPLSRTQIVFWNVHANNMPTFHKVAADRCLQSIAVDVCLDLFLPGSGCELSADRLLADIVPFEVPGGVLSAFRPEHFLLDVSAHLYKESTTLRYIERGKHQRLLQYVDIVALVKCCPNLNWEILITTAEEAAAARNVYFALANAEYLFPSTVPTEVLERLGYIGRVDEHFLREYGVIDLKAPLTWSAPNIAERLFSDEQPAGRSRSPI